MQGTIQHVEASGGDVFVPIIQYMVTALPLAGGGGGTTLGSIQHSMAHNSGVMSVSVLLVEIANILH
jgi:hypothetical protein